MDFFKWNFNISFWWISSLSFYLRIHRRLSAILKTSNKSIWNDAFWYHEAYIFWKFSLYTIHWDKTTVNKNFLWTKCYKKCTLSFPELQLTTILPQLKHEVHLFSCVCGIFHFQFHLIFIKVYIFMQQKAWTLWL